MRSSFPWYIPATNVSVEWLFSKSHQICTEVWFITEGRDNYNCDVDKNVDLCWILYCIVYI